MNVYVGIYIAFVVIVEFYIDKILILIFNLIFKIKIKINFVFYLNLSIFYDILLSSPTSRLYLGPRQ